MELWVGSNVMFFFLTLSYILPLFIRHKYFLLILCVCVFTCIVLF